MIVIVIVAIPVPIYLFTNKQVGPSGHLRRSVRFVSRFGLRRQRQRRLL